MAVWMHMNPARKAPGTGADLAPLSLEAARSVRRFHATFKEYAPTPLTSLPGLAAHLGLNRILVKDESFRFGLNAFKVLGGSYAMGRILADRLSLPLESLSRDMLCSPEVRTRTGELIFTTTTDGNHGRGVAWTARELGQKAVVYMPKGSAQVRVDNILALGAQCTVTDMNYDDAVRMTWDIARKHGHIMVQDTAWDGYEDIPAWIMQGYMTLALEALEQMRAMDALPTHMFLQAGVGSFAGAVLGFLAAALGPHAPACIITEPHKANCIYTSAVAGDGRPHAVAGDLDTIMAGLACGEPNTISWNILRDYATAYASCPDYMAANGMRVLAAPLRGDTPVVSGESGAIGMGILYWLMTSPAAKIQRDALGLGPSSTVLCVSTEGDTSPDIWRDIVWRGGFPDEETTRQTV